MNFPLGKKENKMTCVSNTPAEMTSLNFVSEQDCLYAICGLMNEIEIMGPGEESHKLFVTLIEEMLACGAIRSSEKALRIMLTKLDEYRESESFSPNIRWAEGAEDVICDYLIQLEDGETNPY